MPPVAKKLIPSVLTKAEALKTNCAQLYTMYKEQLGTDKMAISVKGARFNAFGYSTHTSLVYIPRTNTFITQHVPSGYEHYEVRVEYKLDFLDPSTVMTRADLVIELFDIWEAMQHTLPIGSKQRDVFTQAQELLLGTFEARELGNQDYMEVTKVEGSIEENSF